MAYDAFLKLDTVAGESTGSGHPGEIALLGYNITVSHPAPTGVAAGKATFADFSFTAPVSKASPVLFVAMASGHVYNQALVSLRRTGTQGTLDFLKITMSNVIVTSMATGGTTGDDAPHDQCTLHFQKIQFSYTQQNASGGAVGTPTTGGWDVTKNAPA